MITEAMFNAGRFWNEGPMVVSGCTKVSEGCMNCWSERAHVMRCRNPKNAHAWPPECLTDGRFNGKVVFRFTALINASKGEGKVIAPWNDLYHDGVRNSQIYDALRYMANKPHTYLIITKRIDRALPLLENLCKVEKGPLPPNIWHIVTCENQARADERIPHLLRIPGKRGIIIEPCLGGMILQGQGDYGNPDRMCGRYYLHGNPGDSAEHRGPRIHQVILGPESGQNRRPMDEAWPRSVEEQCKAADVPFYRKDKMLPEGVKRGTLAWRV